MKKNLYPINFSIHESKIIDYIPKKTKLCAHIIPGDLSTYIYNNEIDYYNDYKKSLFAITCSKAGIDCLRHYEILANGCIPYFIDLDICPENTLILFPKKIILKAMKIYDILKDKISPFDDIDNINKCYKIIEELLYYIKKNLSNRAIATYILNKTNNSNCKNILFLSGLNEYALSPDYLRCLTLTGFKDLYGEKCHDFPKIEHIYKDFINTSNLYGKGISYTNNIDSKKRNNNLDNNIETDIISHKYDIIIYGSCHRGLPFLDIVNKTYKPNEIIVLCGEDKYACEHSQNIYNLQENNYNLFIRELSEIL